MVGISSDGNGSLDRIITKTIKSNSNKDQIRIYNICNIMEIKVWNNGNLQRKERETITFSDFAINRTNWYWIILW